MNQYQFHAPILTKWNKVILIGAGASFLVHSILKAIGLSLVQIFALSPSGLMSGFIFQLVTYPFVETQLMSFIFNSLLIWFIGSELESQWGSRVYLRFMLMVSILVGLVYSLIIFIFFYGTSIYSNPFHGLAGLNFALLIAYAVLYPDRSLSLMMIFPMKARTFCLILAGIEAYVAIFSGGTSSWGHLLAMGLAYLILRFQSNPLIYKALNASFPTKKRSKNHLYVVKDEDQKPPKFWQ